MSKLLLLLLLSICAAAHAADIPSSGQVRSAFTNFESNLPVVFLEAKEAIVSERKVPCVVRMVLPKGSEAGSTGALTGVVRFHGATSQGPLLHGLASFKA